MIGTVTALLAEGGEHAQNGLWFPHDWKEMLYGSLAFFIVVGLLWKKGGPALKKAMAARSERIENQMTSAEKEKLEAEAERDRIKAALADSDAEAARIVEDARKTADALGTELDARAEADAVALRERAVADLASQRRQAVADLTSEVSTLALGAAEKVVHNNIDHQDLIEQYINKVGASN